MKKFYILLLIASLAFFVSCQKQAEERPVLTAEEKLRLEVREKEALAEKAAANAPAVSTVPPAATPAPN